MHFSRQRVGLPDDLVVKMLTPVQWGMLLSLVRELKSHLPCGLA